MPNEDSAGDVVVHPVTPSRWKDLERLFGPSGAYSNCWCMWFRLTSKEFDAGAKKGADGAGTANRRAMKELVERRRTPGLIAYRGREPVGWVSVAPRSEYGRIERSPTLKPVDDRPVWSIVCFFIHRRHRGTGVATALLDAAVDHARRRGARVVEAYPEDPGEGRLANATAYTGVLSMFEAAGFSEVARRGKRPIMRRELRPS